MRFKESEVVNVRAMLQHKSGQMKALLLKAKVVRKTMIWKCYAENLGASQTLVCWPSCMTRPAWDAPVWPCLNLRLISFLPLDMSACPLTGLLHPDLNSQDA